MINEKALRTTAVEMNRVLGVDPPFDVKEKSVKILTEQIVEFLGLKKEDGGAIIDPKTDVFSDTAMAVIKELNPNIYSEEIEEVETVDSPLTLLEEVDACEDLSVLKTIAKSNDEFKDIRGRLSSYKKAEDLKDEMLGILNDAGNEQQEVANRGHEKNIASQPVRTSADVKQPAKPAKTKDEPKTKTGGFKKAGSFAEFLDNRVKEGGTWQEIYDEAKVEAESRDKKTSIGAIRSHVKFRVGKNEKFLGKLKIKDDGIF